MIGGGKIYSAGRTDDNRIFPENVFCVFWSGEEEVAIEKREKLPRSKKDDLICRISSAAWVDLALQGENLYPLPEGEYDETLKLNLFYAPVSYLRAKEIKLSELRHDGLQRIQGILANKPINLVEIAKEENVEIRKYYYV